MCQSDRDNYVSLRNQRLLYEALGKDNISVLSITDRNNLDNIKVSSSDIVITQSRDGIVREAIQRTGAKNTSECDRTISLTKNKQILKEELQRHGIMYPKSYALSEVKNGKFYFVKPLRGEDSNCIDIKSLCRTKEEIEDKAAEIKNSGDAVLIEDFIDGEECTAACIVNQETGEIEVYPIFVGLTTPYKILTHEAKFSENEICSPCNNGMVKQIAEKICRIVGLRHYMRIDFRIRKGVPYVIDCNLFPGLGTLDHFAKCLLLCKNISYIDALKKIIATASL